VGELKTKEEVRGKGKEKFDIRLSWPGYNERSLGSRVVREMKS
jgi:hypothetical protein